ncbi:MAG: MerR family transcriptional regulator [Ignavibacteria bacterium CG_4_8_14_3_um_filter_37_9]|nr:MerR family transcriptional regulator [Ignavibacteria bacterium]OIO23616.1 MAG: transcriptional regulator [Ignavibacteria bacterium CG1_02_37_35]PIP78684.1 MAG: transcriptional regulator [Ignavibacteria bacterium CG22_combo_CG10-13_8_21_14_all_37_15]PIS46088.1 MAG: MerR family transcriptional regulator [Ignavibacteria bacterium CG08_land_8_20_14_0_20_37_9]PIW99875.1 MAG: MerR family transcriptional regulator [Ignavibacteria bacterium CG_4_8_14_3_um_filter_37_9]PIX92835.1 MAG: MerR family tr
MKDFNLKKLYYSISEVSKITEVEQYVLRYWETEFEQLKPQKNRAGNRVFTNKDIQLILQIKSLLREKRYTIEGAKNILSNLVNEKETHVSKTVLEGKKIIESAPIKVHPDEVKEISVLELLEIKSALERIVQLL